MRRGRAQLPFAPAIDRPQQCQRVEPVAQQPWNRPCRRVVLEHDRNAQLAAGENPATAKGIEAFDDHVGAHLPGNAPHLPVAGELELLQRRRPHRMQHHPSQVPRGRGLLPGQRRQMHLVSL